MVRFVGNNGDSIENAIQILDVKSHFEGIAAEYEYLESEFGKRGLDWELENQSLVADEGSQEQTYASSSENGININKVVKHDMRKFDRMDLLFPNGQKKSVYFEVTNFFGKF